MSARGWCPTQAPGGANDLRTDEFPTEPFAAGVFMPILAGAIVWAGLWLRSETVRSILPLHRN
ncbi:hypothetical protein [Williamsia soli]|uniref:hypothetical protein n=1 Tax=Williamsia soli TaxID=364929 RepID=UPI001A9E98DB|nr:hypothetical protein [Williamsia soli]